jgi:hypothetical protein
MQHNSLFARGLELREGSMASRRFAKKTHVIEKPAVRASGGVFRDQGFDREKH